MRVLSAEQTATGRGRYVEQGSTFGSSGTRKDGCAFLASTRKGGFGSDGQMHTHALDAARGRTGLYNRDTDTRRREVTSIFTSEDKEDKKQARLEGKGPRVSNAPCSTVIFLSRERHRMPAHVNIHDRAQTAFGDRWMGGERTPVRALLQERMNGRDRQTIYAANSHADLNMVCMSRRRA